MTSKVIALQAEQANDLAAIREIGAKIDATPDDQLDALIARSDEINARIALRAEQILKLDGMGKAGAEAQRELDRLSAPQYGQAAAPADEVRSVGEQFAADTQIRAWIDLVAPGGQVRSGNMPASPVVQLRALTSGSAAIQPQVLAPQLYTANPFLDLNALIPEIATTSNAVIYPRETFANAAAVVAETTQASRNHATNGVKPESSLAYDMVTATIDTVAHTFGISRQMLADLAFVEGQINAKGEIGLREKLAAYQMGKLLAEPAITSQAFAVDMIATARKSITRVRVDGRANPDAFVMHPEDVEKLDLSKDAENRYYFGGPVRGDKSPLWSLRIVESVDIPVGTALVGDFAHSVERYKRQDPTLYVSDSHADWFFRNLVAFLFEMRVGLGITRPQGLKKFSTAA